MLKRIFFEILDKKSRVEHMFFILYFIFLIIMWNIAASSKILQGWSQDKNFQQHKQRIAKIKSVIKLKHPEQPEFIYAKPKLEQLRRERLAQIARQNDILVRKMNLIYESKHVEDKLRPESQWLKSLHQKTNNQVQVKIDEENKKLCDRIMQAHTHYPTYKIVNDSAKLSKTSLNISANARRFRSISKNSLARPHSATFLNGSRFVRSGGQKQNRYEEDSVKQKKRMLMRPMSAPSKITQQAIVNNRIEFV